MKIIFVVDKDHIVIYKDWIVVDKDNIFAVKDPIPWPNPNPKS